MLRFKNKNKKCKAVGTELFDSCILNLLSDTQFLGYLVSFISLASPLSTHLTLTHHSPSHSLQLQEARFLLKTSTFQKTEIRKY